jgi:3-hydroxyisobutyrate dehydrogenase-like beta-hydroxyacid dehydrogenase
VTDVVLHTGPVGTAMATKVANNYLAATQAAVTLQVMSLAIKLGCDPATTAEALRLGSGSNYYVNRFFASHVLAGQLASGVTIEVMQKDVLLAAEIAGRVSVPLVGQTDLPALIDRCVETYGRDASYNALALSVSDEAMVALGGTFGVRLSDA